MADNGAAGGVGEPEGGTLLHRVLQAGDGGPEGNLRRWYRLIGAADDEPTEIQALAVRDRGHWKENRSAYALTLAEAVRLVTEADAWASAEGIYLLANRLAPDVWTRHQPNRFRVMDRGESTTDSDIDGRRVLLVDCDVRRVKHTSARDEQVAESVAVGERVAKRLADIVGRSSIGIGMTGNGGEVLLALDALPTAGPDGDAVTRTVSAILAALHLRFSTATIKVDQSVIDPKRLLPAWGSFKRKGAPGIATHPHRRTGLLVPATVNRLDRAGLDALLEALRADLDDKGRAEVDKALGRRTDAPRTERTAVPAAAAGSTIRATEIFRTANDRPIREVLERLGLMEGEHVKCVGCGTAGDSSVAIVGNGVKCLHDRCANKAKKGFRTVVDIALEHEGITAREAAVRVCGWYGIEVEQPARQEEQSQATAPTERADYDDSDEAIGEAGNGVPKTPPMPKRAPLAATDIIGRWRNEGQLMRIPTGIVALDDMCRGGLPSTWRVIIVGAPSAGKTALQNVIANHMARGLSGIAVAVGILAVDEEPDDLTVRAVQMAGFTVEQAEQRDRETLDKMAAALAGLPLRLYDATWTIEAAGADLASWAGERQLRAALFVDSIQTARSDAAVILKADSERALVSANVNAIRDVSTNHHMLVVATSEANRNSYRSEAAAGESNDLAAGAESRAIEYGAQTQLMLRTPKNHPDIIHVRVAKNRRAGVGELWLRLDRDRHAVAECADPTPAGEGDEKRAEGKRRRNQAQAERDARALLEIVRATPGIGERPLRDAWKAAGRGGVERLGAARHFLFEGLGGWQLVDRGTGAPGKPRAWHLQAIREDA